MKNYIISIVAGIFILPVSNLQSQAPVCIENFENECDFTWFIYEEPKNAQCYQASEIQGSDVLDGNVSLQISWNLANCNYFGWGVDLTNGDAAHGYDASRADTLSFEIKLSTGDEKFRINIKDTDNTQRGLSSELFVEQSNRPQVVKIPMSRFHRRVNRVSLKDINFSFSSSTASIQGNILIDDLKFEFH